jgi:hypothetical protein
MVSFYEQAIRLEDGDWWPTPASSPDYSDDDTGELTEKGSDFECVSEDEACRVTVVHIAASE